MTIFETERLLVRRYSMDDLESFQRLNGDPAVVKYIRKPKTAEESREFLVENIEFYETHPHMGRWAMMERQSNTFVGSFAIIPLKGTQDLMLGYSLLPEYWGLGYASEAVQGGIDYSFGKMHLASITAVTMAPNLPSQKVLLKSGFIKEKEYLENGVQLILFRLQKQLDSAS